MKFSLKFTFLAGASLLAAGISPHRVPAQTAVQAASPAAVAFPHEVVRLENGLTLVMQPDTTLPNVGVELWTRGGAGDEKQGQFGLAHLFEHQVAGAPTGVTSNSANRTLAAQSLRGSGAGADKDYVNIYRIVAPEGLEVFLANLADQIEPRPSKFTEDRLKKDRDIVVSELRRNQAIEWNSDVRMRLSRGTFGAGHPYGHVDSETDVQAATLPLVREWSERFGGAAQLVVFIVGNFDPAAAKPMVDRHFGTLPPGSYARLAKGAVPEPRSLKEEVVAPFSRAKVFLQWPTPGWGTPDADRLTLLSRILHDRFRRLGDLNRSGAATQQYEWAGEFSISGEAAAASTLPEIETRLAAELRELLRTGPSQDELDRAKAQWRTQFLLQLQNPVWRGSRAEAIGRGLLFHGDPNHYQKQMERIATATAGDVRAAGRRWLSEDGYVLHVLPESKQSQAEAAAKIAAPPRNTAAQAEPPQVERPKVVAPPRRIDRSGTIARASAPELRLPVIEEKALAGGGKLIVASRPNLPLARVTLAFRAGLASDDAASAGRARAVLEALPQIEVASNTSLTEALADLGTELEPKLDRDFASLSFTVLREQLEPATQTLLRALAKGPSDELLASSLEDLRQEAKAASTNAREARPRILACAVTSPCQVGLIDGAGSARTLASLSPSSLRNFYTARYHSGNAVALFTGPGAAGRIAGLIEAALPARGPSPRSQALTVRQDPPKVTVVDSPGAAQASVLLIQMLPDGLAADPLPAELVTKTFRQRLMEILRTQKGWSYEMYPYGNHVGRDGSFLFMNMPLQSDKVGLAIREVDAEAARLRTAPVDDRFMATTKGYLQGEIVSGLSALNDINAQLLEAERGGLNRKYYSDFLTALPGVTSDRVRRDAELYLHPDRFVWAVAGDLKTVGPALKAANLPFTVATSVP